MKVKDRTIRKKMVCDICGKVLDGFGNRADPVKPGGYCCDHCNITLVIPARKREVHKRYIDTMYGQEK